MVRHPILSAFCLLAASVVLCFPLTLTPSHAQNPPVQIEDSIIITASRALVTGLLSIGQGEVPMRGFPLIVQGHSNTFVVTTTMEGTFQVIVPPDSYTVKLANAPHPVIGFSINELTWRDRWKSFSVWTTEQQGVDSSHDLGVVNVEFHNVNEIIPGKLQVSIEPQ